MTFLPPPFNTPIFGIDADWYYGVCFGLLLILLTIKLTLPIWKSYSTKKLVENKHTKTEDTIPEVSMDNVKTKEEHPMGDKTHD